MASTEWWHCCEFSNKGSSKDDNDGDGDKDEVSDVNKA